MLPEAHQQANSAEDGLAGRAVVWRWKRSFRCRFAAREAGGGSGDSVGFCVDRARWHRDDRLEESRDRPGHQDLAAHDDRRGVGLRLEPGADRAGGRRCEALWAPGRRRQHGHAHQLAADAPGRGRRARHVGSGRGDAMECQSGGDNHFQGADFPCGVGAVRGVRRGCLQGGWCCLRRR